MMKQQKMWTYEGWKLIAKFRGRNDPIHDLVMTKKTSQLRPLPNLGTVSHGVYYNGRKGDIILESSSSSDRLL